MPQGGLPLPVAQVPREGARQEQAGEADQEAGAGGGTYLALLIRSPPEFLVFFKFK